MVVMSAPTGHADRDQSIVASSYITVLGRSSVPEERVPGLGWPLPPGVEATPDYRLNGPVAIGWGLGGAAAADRGGSW